MNHDSRRKLHIPKQGAARGMEGPAVCGRWARYPTGDHMEIVLGAAYAVRERKASHYCMDCLFRHPLTQTALHPIKPPPEYDTFEQACYVSRNVDPQGRVVRTERGKWKVVPR